MPQNIKNVIREFAPTANFLGTARESSHAWMLKLVNVFSRLHLNYTLSSGALAIGTTTTKARTTASVTFAVNGVLRTAKASTDDLFTLPATVIPVSSIGAFLFYLDSSGAASVVSVTPVSGANPDLLDWPEPADDKVCIGYITVATNGSTTFTGATTALSAAGVTTTYYNGFPQQWVPRLNVIQ